MIDREKSDDHSISSKYLDMLLKMAYKIPLSVEKDKTSNNFSIPGSVLDYMLPKENDNINMSAKKQEKISSRTQSTNTSESESKSKLLFIRQTSSDRAKIRQDESQRKYDSANQVPRYVSE